MFCITCRQTPERTAAAARHFQERGLSVEFFAGVHGRAFGLRTALAHGRDHVLPPGHRMLSGHVGLVLSHYMLWTALTHLPYDEVLILEDDATFGPDFAERFRQAYAELPADWQMVYVGSFGDEGRPAVRLSEHVAVVRYPLGTHAYLVRRSTLGLLLRTNQEARTHIDVQLAENSLPYLNCYTFLPPLVGQRTYDGTWPSSTSVTDEPDGPVGEQ
jgi:GR25 family glycosyltransferase involved in LPS biosynthesis